MATLQLDIREVSIFRNKPTVMWLVRVHNAILHVMFVSGLWLMTTLKVYQ